MEYKKAREQDGLPPAKIVTKAVFRAGTLLGLSNTELGHTLGLSPPTITRMRKGEYVLDGKPLELAILLVRLYRSLDAIVGGDGGVATQWLQADNLVLKDKPVNLIQKVTGLFNVINYLDSRRAIS